MDPARMYDESYEADKAQEMREFNGVKLYYSRDEYLFLPVSGEDQVTEEERKREEEDPHFYISYGSDEREIKHPSFVTFVMDDVMYCMLSFDTNMTSEEMLDMAEEIITAR